MWNTPVERIESDAQDVERMLHHKRINSETREDKFASKIDRH